MMKRLTFALALALCSLASHAQGVTVKEAAVTTAVTDSISTYAALSAGAVEANPLAATSPAGLVALAELKWGLVEWVDASDRAKPEKAHTLRAVTPPHSAVTANNILIALSATGPLAVAGGVVAAVVLWRSDYADETTTAQPGH